ncbi:Transposase and inactivated derivatives-like protein [Burkholderia multivorans ATCC 17616]|jgi:transposase|nr:Transposase and inactivated derivatives-like protein [Burkholderia multivorans ATCC 17616]AIO72540.1 transposase family protein [Burkholderia multivorans]MDR9089408.1 hypothetical protein [Burkholderia multivorans]MDR9112556.1 hypothetical protein [Burkholderia multivorans]
MPFEDLVGDTHLTVGWQFEGQFDNGGLDLRIWFYRKPAWAQKAWEQWFEQAQQSGIAALQKFAERLQGYWHGIVTRCRHPLNTSIVEGINNTIKVIKRRAYGYRDDEYFFLKIRAAFPGNPR